MGSVILKFLAGATAGLLVWAVMEPSAPQSIYSAGFAIWSGKFVLLLGSVIGLAVGGLEGYTRGGKTHTIRGLVLGLIFGAVGATLGSGIGTSVVQMCFHGDVFGGSAPLPERMAARTVAFIPIGMMLGAAIGMSSLTPKRAIQGMVGGALAGAISGAFFDPISQVVGNAILTARGQTQGEVGIVGRAVMAIMLGAMIALFIGLVERFARSAWLRLSLGRNEGKEWSIDGAQTFIGRSESAQVPLFGDGNVAPIHASITRQGPNFVLTDNGSPIGTFLNGQRIGQVVLFHGAQIQIGGFILQFLLKGHAAPARGPEAYAGQAYPLGGQAPQGSPYPRAQMPQQMPQSMPQQMPQLMPYGQSMPFAQPGMPVGQPTQAFPTAASNPTVAFAPQPSPQAGGFTLVAMDGPLLGQRFPVAGSMDVGRECPSIPMSFDAGASRRHATLVPSFNGIAVTDLGSTNGTFLNGNRVSQATATPGDMLKLGSTTFRVETA
jgi:pSer/pThr/pTyr-binding forkhead associated (FHA) protein